MYLLGPGRSPVQLAPAPHHQLSWGSAKTLKITPKRCQTGRTAASGQALRINGQAPGGQIPALGPMGHVWVGQAPSWAAGGSCTHRFFT